MTAVIVATDERSAYTNGLRQLADWLDANPGVPLPYTGSSEWTPFQISVWSTRDELVRIVSALPGIVTKRHDPTVIRALAKFDGLTVEAYAGREQICERVVVGTETVTVPAVEAKPERTEERDVVEWRCHPILADGEGAAS